MRHNPDYTTTINDQMFVAVQLERRARSRER